MNAYVSSGVLVTNSSPSTSWVNATVGSADMYSGWVRCSGNEGFVCFHYKLISDDWAGYVRIQAHNNPEDTSLDAVNVEFSDGSSGVNVAAGANSSGFLHIHKNKANYFRMFLDRTSGSGTNKISCTVHQ